MGRIIVVITLSTANLLAPRGQLSFTSAVITKIHSVYFIEHAY